MKRVVKASRYDDIIFEDEYFTFYKESGIGVQDTPWDGLAVASRGLAEKHVVDIRLTSKFASFDGNPVHYKYYSIYVANGIRSVANTLDETLELVEVLQDAVDFSYRVIDWIRNHKEYDGGI